LYAASQDFLSLTDPTPSGVRFTADRKPLGLLANVCEMEHTSLARRSKVSHRDSESEAFEEVTTSGYGKIGTIIESAYLRDRLDLRTESPWRW